MGRRTDSSEESGPGSAALPEGSPDAAAVLVAEIARARDAALAALGNFAGGEEASSLDALARWEDEHTGKHSVLATAKSRLAGIEPDRRRDVGRVLNETRHDLSVALADARSVVEAAVRGAAIVRERMDLTEVTARPRAGHLHLVSRTRDALEDVFVAMGFDVAEGPEAETDWYNFEALNIPPDHPARSMWDTLFLDVDGTRSEVVSESPYVMRTHTSPVQIHLMEEQGPPLCSVMPGRTYRRETPDARHLATFHQIEGLVVDRGITFGHLAGTIEAFTTAYFGPSIHSRLRPSYFPFTEPSAEFEISCAICEGSGCRTCSQTGWIELGGCGMVDPAVFAAVGIDPEEWSGFAFGFGIDRCAQMKHSISDMRVLIANDVRFLEQF